jgi:pyruvate dehydrogenase E1 component beta subunit
VAALVAEDEEAFYQLDAPIMRVAGADVCMPYAHNLEILALPTSQDVMKVVLRVMGNKTAAKASA